MIPTPDQFGLPPKFDSWRTGQGEALLKLIDSPKRFVMLGMPTGSGKSAVYIAASLMKGKRAAVLTSTKGLQSQVLTDFEPCGLVDIRGMGNYPCRLLKEGGGPDGWKSSGSCEDAPCHAGHACSYRDKGCDYYDAYRSACRARLVVTNYSYWLHIYKYGEGLGYFDTVVLDEAHNAPDELSKFLSIEIERHEIEGEHPIVEGVWPSPAPTGVSAWKLWASPLADQAEELLETIRAELSINPLAAIKRGMSPWKLRGLSSLARRLRDLASIAGEWVVETGKKGGKVKFDPIWAAPYADMLFRGSTKVVLASATIRPKTGQLIGINPQDLDFMECPSTFPKENRPFIWVPTVRLSSNSTDGDLRLWLDRIDEIVGQRLDRKGIIHTVSYARRDLILEHSIHAAHMISHATESAEFTVSKFKTGRYRVLVSPSMATGWDFPGDECRYQIIAKVPFPDLRTPITRARMKKDSEYLDYLTAQQIVQTYGRGVRSPDDWCECIVVDDNCDWFIRKARKFLPRWFKEAIRPPVRIFDLAPLNPNGTERRA